MSDIRMIDRFIGNVRLCGDTIEDDEFTYVTLCGTPRHESCIDGAYIVHAINNHDRLVEENAKLKADKTELLKEQWRLQSLLYDALGCKGYFDAASKGVYPINPVRIYTQEDGQNK